ncbi:MAG: Holliday junction resolvase RuvX [Puniceicoccales bacterium]|jgi:putative Holliday junction resolvase|nr:Holliday junction resolvase RuvX [Puniceicoccales bacterium]
MANYLGLDVGRKRIGLSSGSDDLKIALPGCALPAHDRMFCLRKIADFISEACIEVVVVGYPFNLDGSKSNMCNYVDEFVASLKLLTEDSVTFAIFDEYLTSNQAEAELRVARGAKFESRGRKRRLRRIGAIDSNAAAIVLQGYFDELAVRTSDFNENRRK